MKYYLVFTNNVTGYGIVLQVSNNEIEYLKYESYDEHSEDNSTFVNLNYDIFYSFSKLLGLNLKKFIRKKEYLDVIKMNYFQNEDSEKLVINGIEKHFMKKKFVSSTNEKDYIKLPNKIYDLLISALKENEYNEVDFSDYYFIAKDYIYNNLDEIINESKFNSYYMIEKYDYFDIDLITDKFIKYFNDEISEDYFQRFCYFMLLILNPYSSKMSLKKERIYYLISDLFDGLSFGVEWDQKQELCERYADIKHLYNELHNVEDEDVIIYYNFNHCNHFTDTCIYEITIVDKNNKKYWIGFVENPMFDFNVNYKNVYNLKQIYDDQSIDEDDDEDDYNYDYLTFTYLPDDYYEKYSFDETLKDKHLKK